MFFYRYVFPITYLVVGSLDRLGVERRIYANYLNMKHFLTFFIFSMGGTAGAIITCPLEVVKTRLQSSNSGFGGGGSGGGVRPPELRVSGGGPRGTATGEHLPSGKDWRKQNYSSLDRLQWSHHRNLSRMAAATSPERERLLRTLSRASKRGTHSLNGGGGGKQVMNVFECLR